MVNPCTVIDALADFQYDLMRRLNKKFEQLRRLAVLLEQLGDLTSLLPNLNALIPVSQIDLSVYLQLAAACPFLGLPKPSDTDLAGLRDKVLSAYAAYARKILGHPYMRMGKVQEALTEYQNQINSAMGIGADYISCLKAACAAGTALQSAVSKVSETDWKKTISAYTENYVTNAGKVLTEPMEQKYALMNDTLKFMQDEMGTDIGKDYKYYTSKKAYEALSQRPTVTLPSGQKEWKNPPYYPLPPQS
jgi:hypothetical protein